jgi:hypothetical protein
VATALPAWLESYPVARGIEVAAGLSATTVAQVDLPLSEPVKPKEPDWPTAQFLVGNAPFLGGELVRMNRG